MNIAIIGAGLIGRKRAGALPENINLSIVCDVNKKRAKKFAGDFHCQFETNWKEVIKNPNIQALIISTTNKYLPIIARESILAGKHILIEKPGARNLKELQELEKTYQKRKVVIMFGYNHRYHPSILLAKKIIESKKYGKILFIRARYGHGGRLGYEKEWRFNKEIAGGGELLDQGSHLIDLINFFNGQMELHNGLISKLFWSTSLEDSAFIILKNKKENSVAFLSATCVEWKNIFSFEIILDTAKIQIDGLGRSYGEEKLTLFTMKPKLGLPKIKEFSFPEEDLSWKKENEVFFKKIKSGDTSNKSLKEAVYVLKIIEKVYKQNKL